MKPLSTLPLALGLMIFLNLPATAALHHPGMPEWAPSNFDRVSDSIYRGGRIIAFEQVKRMHEALGVETVINLARDSLGPRPNEIDWTKSLKMKYLPVYLGSEPPTEPQWQEIKATMRKGHVYVHCAHGADRTGAIVARYRQDVEGWTPKAAYEEARKYGFKPWLKSLRKWMNWP